MEIEVEFCNEGAHWGLIRVKLGDKEAYISKRQAQTLFEGLNKSIPEYHDHVIHYQVAAGYPGTEEIRVTQAEAEEFFEQLDGALCQYELMTRGVDMEE